MGRSTVRVLAAAIVATTAFFLSPTSAQAQLTDAQRIELCRQAVLACQLRDGAVVAVAYQEAGRPALVEPYFAHLACSGILAAEQMSRNPRNREFVKKWLKWYAVRQKQDNGIFVIEGKRGRNGLVDATRRVPDSLDSYAALYLYVAGRYAKTTKEKLDPDVTAACLRMLNVLESCRSSHDLFWNFPENAKPPTVTPAEYLLDNVEVHQGLSEIVAPLAAAGYVKPSQRAHELAVSLAKRMGEFWSPQYQYYVCMFGDRAADIPFGKQPLHAEGLATVSALALFDNVPAPRREALWTRLQTAYAPKLAIGFGTDNYPLEDPTIERVYLAALRAGSQADRVRHLALLRTRLDALLIRNRQLSNPAALADGNPFPYCHRFGLMLIALASPASKATPYLPSVPLPMEQR